MLITLTGGTAPANLVAALLNLANNSSLNTTALFELAPANAPFQPALNIPPPDFTIHLSSPTTLQLSATAVTLPQTAVGNSLNGTGQWRFGRESSSEGQILRAGLAR
ncbi:hypothetical protein SAMN05421770_101131 [Granulicella rosea]|uniref:Uncharacterized protein n=1 Tax=Granulicella rosea TaxID=474952 RepID=A0A239CV17_9BACT|nr:hypothetical protein [Granulicella rosea]SNS24055.1 hypothetical protein SAMN05421770_101131 [Granulicella rosea]